MYEKPVRILMQEMIPAMGIKQGDIFNREQVVKWFAEQYPKIKIGTVAAHLTRSYILKCTFSDFTSCKSLINKFIFFGCFY